MQTKRIFRLDPKSSKPYFYSKYDPKANKVYSQTLQRNKKVHFEESIKTHRKRLVTSLNP